MSRWPDDLEAEAGGPMARRQSLPLLLSVVGQAQDDPFQLLRVFEELVDAKTRQQIVDN